MARHSFFSPTMKLPTITLKSGRSKSLLRGHPWVFSGAVQDVAGEPRPGETVRVVSQEGEYLATGAYSPESNIRVRVWSREEGEVIDRAFIRARIERAVGLRVKAGLLDETNTACRLVFAESDGLPGLIVDRYNDRLVAQFLSTGPESMKGLIVEELQTVTGLKDIYERSDVDVRQYEGLQQTTGLLTGNEPESELGILENGLNFSVDVRHGHKTGFYLDQRFNREKVRALAAGAEVLNCFAYTGAFSAAALAGGAAHTLSIEASQQAVEQGRANLQRNGFKDDRADWITGDVFVELRTLRDRRSSFDLIVLDPPKFAATRHQAESASRGYKDINLLAFKLLRPGGILVTFSCSGGIDADFFQKIIAGAALDAGCEAQIIDRLTQGPDHPTALAFPESQYLKGLVIHKMR